MWLYIILFVLALCACIVMMPPQPAESEEMRRFWVRLGCMLVVIIQYCFMPLFWWLICALGVIILYCYASKNPKFNEFWRKVQHLWQDFGEYSEVYESHMMSNMSATSPPIGQPMYMTQPSSYMAYTSNLAQAQDSLPAEAWYADKRSDSKQEGNIPIVRPSNMDNLRRPVLASYAKYRRDNNLTVTPSPPRRVPQQQRSPTSIPQPRYTNMEFRKRKSPGSPDLIPRRTNFNAGQFTQIAYQSSQGGANTESYKSRILSALSNKSLRTVPPGLINNGQNICFMNSVLQCLAHSPDLVGGLVQASHCNSEVPALVSSLAVVLQGLYVKPGSYGEAIVDTTQFRHVISSLPSSMIAPLEATQYQQDAGEFLTWLLQYTHSALNNIPKSQQTSIYTYHNNPVKTLKFIYGDLSEQHIEELKTQCRQEIERASMTDGVNYAEPLQRLADLEWLSYKEKNSSIIDDLFTGMRMEAQQCLGCNRISVFPQPFNVLTVPLTEPSRETGLAYLSQCFDKFGHIEELYGPEGLQCSCATRKMLTVTPAPLAKHKVFIKDAPVSPILGNGHMAVSPSLLAQDNMTDVVRTSTPIRMASPSRRTCGKRRSLLRQLPQCLIVQLMRFSYKDGQLFKDTRPVQVELHDLDLGHLVVDSIMQREDLASLNDTHHYQLYGLCLHLGGQASNCGHYVAYARTMDGHWYKYDDEIVTPLNMDYELNTRTVRENAYLLLYRKKDQNPVRLVFS